MTNKQEKITTTSPSWAYTIDKTTGAEYISCVGEIKRGKVTKTKKLRENLLIDLDEKGKVLGIEILDKSPVENEKKEGMKCCDKCHERITNNLYYADICKNKKNCECHTRGWDKDGRFYQCSDGKHPSWWQSIIKTPQWDAWYEHASKNMLYDVDESFECGAMSEKHAKDFLNFVAAIGREAGRKEKGSSWREGYVRGKEEQRFADEEVIKAKYFDAGYAQCRADAAVVVPEEAIGDKGCGDDVWDNKSFGVSVHCESWNACRQAILTALSSLTHKE